MLVGGFTAAGGGDVGVPRYVAGQGVGTKCADGGEAGLHPCADLFDASGGAVLRAGAGHGGNGQVPVWGWDAS